MIEKFIILSTKGEIFTPVILMLKPKKIISKDKIMRNTDRSINAIPKSLTLNTI